MNDEVRVLLEVQSGVVSRRQVLAAGLRDHEVRRLLRRREWARVHDGVFVTHTGPLTWTQRSWAAVLAVAPAALCHVSALRATDGPGRRHGPTRADDGPIHVAVDRKRSVVEPEGVVLHHLAHLDDKALWHTSPPRLRVEEAVLDVAAESPSDFAAVARLADAIQSRSTTAARIQAALHDRTRLARRPFLEAVLADLADGACSALEQGYLARVERPHGLPRGHRQPSAWAGGRIYRDVEYDEQGVVVELDGRLFHDSAGARDRDLDRDLDTAVGGRTTVRLGWGQVFDRGCATAGRIGLLLHQRGWTGSPTPCPRCALTGQPWILATS